MRIAILFVLALGGCSALVNPDTGRLASDAGPQGDAYRDPSVDAGIVPSEPDASPSINGDAGPSCAGVPVGNVVLPVTSTTCEGPFSLAVSFSGRVREAGTSCAVAQGSLRVICDHAYVELPLAVGTLTRDGLLYTSEDTFLGCEGVTYMCHLALDAVTYEHIVVCSYAGNTCNISLE